MEHQTSDHTLQILEIKERRLGIFTFGGIKAPVMLFSIFLSYFYTYIAVSISVKSNRTSVIFCYVFVKILNIFDHVSGIYIYISKYRHISSYLFGPQTFIKVFASTTHSTTFSSLLPQAEQRKILQYKPKEILLFGCSKFRVFKVD